MQVEGLRPLPDPPPRVRLFGDADLHCTLAFFGSVRAEQARLGWDEIGASDLGTSVRGTFARARPLGNPRKPSALSAMIDEGAARLSATIAALRPRCLEAAGAAPDDRAPLPHMTIARIQRRASGAERRTAIAWSRTLDLSAASFAVTSVALYTWAVDRQARLFEIVETRSLRP